MTDALLSIRDLSIAYDVAGRDVLAVSHAGFDVPQGSIVGLVGESGCGKTTMARALTRVIADNARIAGGRCTSTDRIWRNSRRADECYALARHRLHPAVRDELARSGLPGGVPDR